MTTGGDDDPLHGAPRWRPLPRPAPPPPPLPPSPSPVPAAGVPRQGAGRKAGWAGGVLTVVVALARIYLLTVSHRVEDVHQLVVNQPFEAPASIAGVPRNTDEPGRALERRAVQEVGRTPLTVGAYGVEGDGPAYVLVVLPVTVATPPPAADLLAQVARQTGELSDVTMIGVEHGSDIACALLRKTDAGDERACAWVDDTFGYVIGLGPDLRGVARWTGAAREAVRRAR